MSTDHIENYTALDGPALLRVCKDDGRKWAEAFCQHVKVHNPTLDTDYMTGWFANAIETAHDHRTGSGPIVLPDGSAFFVGKTKR